ncbi:hypothetical protein ABZ705_31135 [Streptomyces sp. NPDC006984]|uniref:hypothetical protein n=1 Tax=unclassified Streptomyces TaxID=2593676 RepID=UPI001F2A1003|nr:hypothetical protein [Streptomyces sp. CC210A]
MTIRAVAFSRCQCGKERGYDDERTAEKALGRAQAKRDRAGTRKGTRRGLYRENRFYECDYGMWHLTSQSRAEYLGAAA